MIARLGRLVVKDKLLAEGIPKYLTCPPDVKTSSSKKHVVPPLADTLPPGSTKPHPHTNEVESLTDKASHLDISSTASKPQEQENALSARKRPSKAPVMPIQRTRDSNSCEVRRSPRILAKRVRSVVDEVRQSHQ